MTESGGSARREAERLVAAALDAVRRAASAGTAERFATGSAECCACPVCRAIAAARDPDPKVTQRLVTGAGDLVASVVDLLNGLTAPNAYRPPEPRPASDQPGDRGAGPAGSTDPAGGGPSDSQPSDGESPAEPDVWAAATRASATRPDGGAERRG